MLKKQENLYNGDLSLKKMSIEDAHALHEMLTDKYLCDKAGLPTHTHINQTIDFIMSGNSDIDKGSQYFYGIYQKNTLVGIINLFNINYSDNSGEYGYFIHSNYTRRHIMSESIKLLSNFVFENTNINKINVYVDTDNKASLALAKNLKLVMKESSIQEDLLDRAIEMVRFVINKPL